MKYQKNTTKQFRDSCKLLKKDIYMYIYIYICLQENSIIMEYQKITNVLDNMQNQPTKFRTKNGLK